MNPHHALRLPARFGPTPPPAVVPLRRVDLPAESLVGVDQSAVQPARARTA